MPATPREIAVAPADLELADYYRKLEAAARYRRANPDQPLPPELDPTALGAVLRRWDNLKEYPEAYSVMQLRHLPKPDWLIENTIQRQGLHILYGQPKSGKTFLALEWALTLASGAEEWCGLRLPGKPMRVLYVLLEGVEFISQRVDAWLEAHPKADVDLLNENLVLVKENLSIWEGKTDAPKYQGQAKLEQTRGQVSIHKTDNALLDHRPALLVYDTYSRATPGMDESSNSDVSRLLQEPLGRWIAENRLAVLLVHHTPIGADRPRGASALLGAADASLGWSYNQKTGIRTLHWSDMKNVADGRTMQFVVSQEAPRLEYYEGEDVAEGDSRRSPGAPIFDQLVEDGLITEDTKLDDAWLAVKLEIPSGVKPPSRATVGRWLGKLKIEDPDTI